MDSSLLHGFGARWRAFQANESGSAVVIFAVSVTLLVGAAGLAFDAGRGYLLQSRLSQAVDAAALAGGRSLTLGGGGDYEAQILKYLDANLPKDFMGADIREPDISVNTEGDEITVVASAVIPTTLMRVLQVGDLTVSARAVVNRRIKGLEVSMVLDNSGSMGDGGKISDLKSSANLLLDILYGDNDTVDDLYISLVPFTGRVNLAGADEVHPDSPPSSTHVCLASRAAPHHKDDTTPEEAPFQHFSGVYGPGSGEYENRVCPTAPVHPLAVSKSSIKDAIGDMSAQGCTRYDIGTVWGWRNLSPEWQGYWGNNALPLSYTAPNMQKAIIVMTDGENTPDCVADPVTKAQSEALFQEVCSSMKNVGIVIYTITFKLDDADTNQLFRDCASGEARYFKSPNGEELETAFTTIANDLSTLRLTE